MNEYPKFFGYIPDKPSEKDYGFLGGQLQSEVLVPDGDWTPYLPPFEAQFRGFETSACTVFAFLSALETLARKKGYDLGDFSERFLAITAGIDPKIGGSPKSVVDAARKIGLIQDWVLPFNVSTVEEFYSPKPMTSELLKLANDFQKKWIIGYESVPNDPLTIKEALKHSPLTAAVKAWYADGDIFWFPDSAPYNHDCFLYAFPNNYKFFDSYEQDHKEVRSDAKLQQILRYTLDPRPQEEISLIQQIINLCRKIIGLQSVLVERKVKEVPPPPNVPLLPADPKEVVDHVSLIEPWAQAISQYENISDKTLNNPGAIRGTDGKFLRFQTYEKGFQYLCDYLTRACTGKHHAYPKGGETTLLEFQKIYSPTSDHNDPDKYAKFIASELKVETSIKIKLLL